MAGKIDTDSDLEEEAFIVERVVDKRVRAGKTEFLLKWKGYQEKENTWEPEDNLDCPDLIQAFETSKKEAKQRRTTTEPKPSLKTGASGSSKKESASKASNGSGALTIANGNSEMATEEEETAAEQSGPAHGFDRGMSPEKIVGATDSSGDLMFLMKWKNSDEADLVMAKVANAKCPQIVIQFYEERLTWHTRADEEIDLQAAIAPIDN